VNIVIPNSKSVVAEAIKLAQEITANSPDAVQAAKNGLLLAQNLPQEEAVLAHLWSRHSERLYEGRNIKEGLQAFATVCAQISFSLSLAFFLTLSFLFSFSVSPCVLDPRC
jgi:enoyl-CoA hydratase/carnithine racemase